MLASCILVGCAPGTADLAPSFPFVARYQGAPPGAPVLLTNDQWWLGLKDPMLNQLIDLALRDSLTLAAARARVDVAQAQVQAVPGAATLDAESGLQRRTASGFDLLLSADLGFSWLLDPWGARKAELRSAAARLEAARADSDAARLLVLLTLSNAYLDLRYQQQQLALARDEQASRRQTLALTRTLSEAGAATRLEITRSEARVAEIGARLPGLQAAIQTKINEITVLAGQAPGQLTLTLDQPAALPRPALAAKVGIPADLLRNRPDIRVAEAQYYSSRAALDAAEAARYPRLSLIGTLSLSQLEGGEQASSYVFGPQLILPTLPNGSARAKVAAQSASMRASEAQWRQTVIGAIAEVENSLIDYQAQTQALSAAGQAMRLYQEAGDLTNELFSSGEATLTDLIEVETALSEARRNQADAQYRHAQSFVALNVRLGSGAGWRNSAPPR